MNGRSLTTIAVMGVLAALIAGCPPPAQDEIQVTVRGAGESANELSREEIVELARREAELWWYTSLPEEQAQQFLERFEEAHPYVDARLVRGSTFDIVRRVDRELARGQVRADALHVLDPGVFDDLRRRGELYAYRSEHAHHIPPEYQEPGQWTAMRAVVICIAYDTTRRPDRLPETWPDLLDPRWREEIGLKDAQTGGSAYAQYYLLREEYGASFWRRMAAQRPQLFRSSSDTLNALTAGEIDLAGGILGYSVYQAMQEGTPVAPIWPRDGVPMTVGPVAILSRAPHPHAAILFMDYALSQVGQQAIVEISGCYSLRDDVEPPPERPALRELNILAQEGSWSEYRLRQERLQSEYSRLFHPESE
ncbi:MAG: ABC transporter substrate-binding protein [Armatimonadota bacterium]